MNRIKHILNGDGELIQDMDAIKSLAPEFYQNLFNQTDYISNFPEMVVKKIPTQDAQNWLIKPESQKKMKKALFQMNADKSRGPDGFNASFYQKHWELVGISIYKMVQSFLNFVRS